MIERHNVLVLSALALFASIGAAPASAQVSLATLGTPYTQNFDTLPASGSATWTNNSTIPGWFHARTGTGTTIVANNGSSNAGNLYSYGTGTATDRALGSVGSGNAAVGNLFWGVRLQNNTGATISQLDVSYTGEQWRKSGVLVAQTVSFSYLVGSPTVTGSLAEFQSAGVAVAALDFSSPINTATGAALDGNAAANRTALTFSITGLSIPNGSEVMLRWSDPDHSGADHGLSIDDFSVTPLGAGPVTPTLNVDDVSLNEGDAGTTTFTFTVSLTSPAGPSGVEFAIGTADGSATIANNDYNGNGFNDQTIPAGSSTYTFDVLVNGDTTPEPNETFFVNVTAIFDATPGDTQGQGTINNDDVTLTPIHDIQGAGGSSPLSGSVTTRGIVTGVKSNGFFIQEPDASVDANPATSEGIFVFTSAAPPAAAVVGNDVRVSATIAEFVPSQDPLQPPLTELTSPTVVQLTTGNPLPAPIPLTATFPDPAGAFDQLERLEGMRVSVATMTVSGPTLGNVSEPNATATSTGVFFGAVTGVPRPFREPGIQAPDPAPSGSIPPIPRWDANPELLRVDSDGQTGGLLLDVGAGAIVTGLIGPLDYSFRHYTILPDPASPPSVFGGPIATAVAVASAQELTVASFNLERFFDTVNDPGTDQVLTATAFDKRLAKASLAIRNFLLNPDILGVVEMENLTTLQALAARISSDAVAASQPDPQYTAHLVEGNDVGGIDVGFLVKTAPVVGATQRVTVNAVVQENATETWTDPDDNGLELLNDRPPLRLDAVVNHANGSSFPLQVIVNHSRSLLGIASTAPDGLTTEGERVRLKRKLQADSLANLVQARQTADSTEHIVLVGDFNAFEFNDGFVDSMGTIAGTPPPDNETVVPGDGVDLVNPDLDNLFDTAPAGERYSFVFDGNAQSLDHVLVNQALIASTLTQRVEHPRIDADFPETARNDGTTALRFSDHDPIVAYFQVAAFATADLSVTKVDTPDPVTAGTDLTYTITVTNNGPDAADTANWSDLLPTGTTFVSLAQPGGWTCSTPAVGSGGNVSCDLASLAVGPAAFTLTVHVDASIAAGSVLSNTATATAATADPDTDDLSAQQTTAVVTSADLNITKTDTPDPVMAGENVTYTIIVTNTGPSVAAPVSLSDTLPAGTTFVSLSSPGGWSCSTPAVGSGGPVSCSVGSLGIGSAVFTLTVAVDAGVAGGNFISNTATASAATTDPDTDDLSAPQDTAVVTSADLSLTKTDAPDPVAPGQNLTYTITVANAGPSAAASASLSDPLPSDTTFVSLASPAGWLCTAPPLGSGGLVSCSNPNLGIGSSVFTLIVAVNAATASGTVITNAANTAAATTDPDTGDLNASTDTTVAAGATLSATKTAAGAFLPGSAVTYTVVLTNAGPGGQPDNPGDEFTDMLPAPLTLVSASATSGTASATIATNTVTWNGALPASASVTLTIQATLSSLAAPGSIVSNQGTVSYDADGNGTNETSAPTDDPSGGTSGDATSFAVAQQSVVEIPALDGRGLAALAALLAAAALLVLRGVRH